MAMSSTTGIPGYVPPTLSRVFIFNPKFGPREDNDHEKILFYHPSSTPLDSQQKDVGLSEALTNVTKTFSKGAPCEVMHTKKTRWILNNPEPGYWIVMVFMNSYIQKSHGEIEYIENDLNDLSLGQLLKKTYDQHKLFHGSFERTYLLKNNVEDLRELLKSSFSKILPTISPQNANIYGALSGMCFLPCPPSSFMKVQSLVNVVEMNIPHVKHTLLMFRDYLLWSDLDQDETKILAQFWNENFWNKQKIPPEPKFIYGIEDPLKENSKIISPTVYIGGGATGNESEDSVAHNLVIFQGYGVVCIFLISQEASQDKSFYRKLYDVLLPMMKDSSSLMTRCLENVEPEEFLYIYFNSMNLALKTTIKSKGIELSREIMNTLLEMHENFVRVGDHQGEVMVKTAADNWIIARKSESRELYVLFDQRNKPILEIADDVNLICAKAFKDVFSDY